MIKKTVHVYLDDGRSIKTSLIMPTGWRLWILTKLDLRGIALPWNSIWIDKENYNVEWVRIHEAAHIRQMHRDGRLVFLFRYFWQLLTVGYDRIDYEIEANAEAGVQITSGVSKDGSKELGS